MKTLLAFAFLLVRSAVGGVITFDDLPTNTGCGVAQAVPNAYGGLDWNNFEYVNATVFPCSVEGYRAALTSSPNVGVNGSGNPAGIASNTLFTLASADFAAAWNDGLNLVVSAKSGATTLDTLILSLNTNTNVLETFNFGPVTEVDFFSFGGTENPTLVQYGGGTQFAVDDLAINTPEPRTFELLLFVPVLLVVARRPTDFLTALRNRSACVLNVTKRKRSFSDRATNSTA